MTLQLDSTIVIENLRRYPESLVGKLRRRLREGIIADPDPKRPGFYDLVDGKHTFYVHIPNHNGSLPAKVFLLAHWTR